MKMGIMLVSAIMLAGVCCAQTLQELATELRVIDGQIRDARKQLFQSAHFRELQEARKHAEDEFNRASASIPEIKTIEDQLGPLTERRKTLWHQKAKLEKLQNTDEIKHVDNELAGASEKISALLRERTRLEEQNAEVFAPRRKALFDAVEAERTAMDGGGNLEELHRRRVEIMVKIKEAGYSAEAVMEAMQSAEAILPEEQMR